MVKTHKIDEAVFQVGSPGTGSTIRELRCYLPQQNKGVVIKRIDLLRDHVDGSLAAEALAGIIKDAEACAYVDALLGGKLSTWLLAEQEVPS